MQTPNKAILDFISEQPAQLQSSVGVGIAIAFGILLKPTDDVMEAMSNIVDYGHGSFAKSMRAIAVIGVIDYYFCLPEVTSDAPIVGTQAQFVNAYNARAQKRWSELRQNILSYEALQTYATNRQS